MVSSNMSPQQGVKKHNVAQHISSRDTSARSNVLDIYKLKKGMSSSARDKDLANSPRAQRAMSSTRAIKCNKVSSQAWLT